MEHTALRSILILLAAAVLVVVALKRVKLPTVIAYLATGFIVGPHGLGWIADTEDTRTLAEFGVVFLLFTLGLEFSLPRLIVMRKAVLVLGGLQVLLTTAGTALAAWLFGVTLPVAIVIGGAFAMSSTAIVVKQLAEQNELNLQHGRLTIAVLLFQDLAVIPFLILIPGLTHGIGTQLAGALLLAFGKGALAVIVILAFGRWLLRPLFHQIATTRSAELFTLAVLLFTLASAWGTAALGLSLALGAFLAGMMLAETEYRHQVEADIRPFRDILLGLFFVTVGMLINPLTMARHWWLLLACVALLMLFKTALVGALTRVLGGDRATALRTALALNQGGEFGFALLALGLAQAVIRAPVAEFGLAVIVISMLVSPLLIRFNGAIANRLYPRDQPGEEHDRLLHDIGQQQLHLRDHVVIVGYGRVGQNVARFLEPEGFDFIALDLDPMRVKQAREAGDPAYYGDGTNPAVLKAAGVEHARALVISYFRIPVILKILAHAKKLRPDLPVLVRTRDDAELDKLMQAGATEVIPETLESSLMVAAHLLQLLGVPMKKILRKVQDVRAHRYSLLRSVFRGQDALPIDPSHAFREQLYTVALEPGAHAINRSLGELDLRAHKVVVTALRREGVIGRQPSADTILKTDDVLVLWGTPEDLEIGEEILLRGVHFKASSVKGPA
ncbi:MAG TPA: monovalent cation:proton antiporter-2 (CPA2) family protein [Gammaproteobacteria bacterium]|nr:monovalent cation:proton antiporter-2 (CPA2) family protein [Gammaproteobacteria bacterium]